MERQQATKLAQALSKDLIDIDKLEEEDRALKEIKQEKRDTTDSNESDIVCKTVDAGMTFLKKKKLTASNSNLVYDAIKEQYKRDIVEFAETHQSFFKIMTHYIASLGLVPEDVRHMELKRRLFEFIMKNIEYTKVISSTIYAS